MELLAYGGCFFLLILFTGYFIWYMGFSAPYVPSMGKERRELLETARELLPLLKLKAAVEPGAGDANLSFALARMGFKSVTAVELVPFLSLFARLRKALGGYGNVRIENKDIFKIDYSKFDLAVIYLYPELMAKLEEQLFAQMPKGSRIISNTFSFKKHQPLLRKGKILVYEVA